MKKLKNPKVVIAVLSVLLFFSLSANVFGNNGLIEITAYLNNGIKVTVNGEPFEPVDPNDGTKYVPITYKGRTYLPLRAGLRRLAWKSCGTRRPTRRILAAWLAKLPRSS